MYMYILVKACLHLGMSVPVQAAFQSKPKQQLKSFKEPLA